MKTAMLFPVLFCMTFASIVHTAESDFFNLNPPAGTFSIVAYDPELREFGVAVQSKFLAVGSAVAYAGAAEGAVATQAWGNTTYGPEGLTLLAMGVDTATVVEVLTGKDAYRDFRQIGVVDATGSSAAFTGEKCQDWAGHVTGKNYTVQGNILTGENVVAAMAKAFESTDGPLADRLIAALHAGQAAGGDARGRQSAALLVVREAGGYGGNSDRAIDLRVDDHPDPIHELGRLLKLHSSTFGLVSCLQSYEAFRNDHEDAAAESCLMRAVMLAETLDNVEPAYLNAVAWTLVENNRELDRALVMAEKAMRAEPESPEIIDTVATIYFAKGDVKRAVELQTKAVELKPDGPEYAEKRDMWLEALAKGVADESIAR